MDTVEVRVTGDVARLVKDSSAKVLAAGFEYTEGPAWDPIGRSVVFNEIPSAKTYRVTLDGDLSVERTESKHANGMVFDSGGTLYVCESDTSSVQRFTRDGESQTVASRYGDEELNSPNDIVVGPHDLLYFTDPEYGRIPVYGRDRPSQLAFRGVYRVRSDGSELELLVDDFGQPNGLCFDEDYTTLYVNDTERALIRRFPVDGDGRLGTGEIFAEDVGPRLAFADAKANRLPSGYVDGMKADAAGNVYVTAPDGLWVFDSAGRRLGGIETTQDVGNLCFAGERGETLIICCRQYVCAVEMNVSGAHW